ncbi:MAG: transposase [Pseudomonadota bacterium]
MTRKRFSGEPIIGALNESEAGAKTEEICRRHGIGSATVYGWRKT